jgi:DNA-binding GntR family transcriptional regulator
MPPRDQLSDRLARRLPQYLQDEGMKPDDHLSVQKLADAFNVSRSPITAALALLTQSGLVRHEARRGYFLAQAPQSPSPGRIEDPLSQIYFQLAEDRLDGKLSDAISENLLRERYDLSKADLRSLLHRIMQEGWIEPRPGYGWSFSPMLTTPDALVQTYRLRAAIEPAALLEPDFNIDRRTLDHLAEVEQRLMNGEIETISSDDLYQYGVDFHETLAAASGNPYFLDALKRVNRIRRLLAYRANLTRTRFRKQVPEHLEIIDLMRRGRNGDAAVAMQHHLGSVIVNLQDLQPSLTPSQT